MIKRTYFQAHRLLLSLGNKLILFNSHYWSPCRSRREQFITIQNFYIILITFIFYMNKLVLPKNRWKITIRLKQILIYFFLKLEIYWIHEPVYYRIVSQLKILLHVGGDWWLKIFRLAGMMAYHGNTKYIWLETSEIPKRGNRHWMGSASLNPLKEYTNFAFSSIKF